MASFLAREGACHVSALRREYCGAAIAVATRRGLRPGEGQFLGWAASRRWCKRCASRVSAWFKCVGDRRNLRKSTQGGNMATSSVAGLAGTVKGRVVERGAADYDEARALYNAMIDKRPAAIAYCVDEADVAAGIRFARERGLRLAIRCGGHNGGGLGSVDDGLVLDLSSMNEVTVEPEARMVRV